MSQGAVTLQQVVDACMANSAQRNPQLTQTYTPSADGPDRFVLIGNYVLVLSGIIGMVSERDNMPIYVTFSPGVMSEKYTMVRVRQLCEYVLGMQEECTEYMRTVRAGREAPREQIAKFNYMRTQLAATGYTFDLEDEDEGRRKLAQNDRLICAFLADEGHGDVLHAIETVMN